MQANRSLAGSLEELPLTQDSSRLEKCVQDLADIVGEEASRHELAQVCYIVKKKVLMYGGYDVQIISF